MLFQKQRDVSSNKFCQTEYCLKNQEIICHKQHSSSQENMTVIPTSNQMAQPH